MVAISNNSHFVLWNNDDGSVDFWVLNTSGIYTHYTYGPYPGWRAKALSNGRNEYNGDPLGYARILWTNTNGAIALWDVDGSTGAFYHKDYGPYPGWTAVAMASATSSYFSDPRIMWIDTSGQMSLWDVDGAGNFTFANYGPYAGYTARFLAIGSDYVPHILWTKTDGSISMWNNVAEAPDYTHTEYPADKNSSPVAMSVDYNNRPTVLWNNQNSSGVYALSITNNYPSSNSTGSPVFSKFYSYPSSYVAPLSLGTNSYRSLDNFSTSTVYNQVLFGIPYGPAVISTAGSDGTFSSGTVLAAPTKGTGGGGDGGGGDGGTATATTNPHGYYSVVYSYDKSISSSTDGVAGVGLESTRFDAGYGDTVESASVYFNNYQNGAASAHFRGTFKAKFTWHGDADHPNSPAPAQVTVIKRSVASWATAFYSNFSGNCDTGLGQYHGAGATAGGSDSVTGYASEVKGGATFDVICTPTVDVYGTGGGGGAYAYASASFTAAAVFMNLANTKPDSSKLDNILIGQRCTGSFSSIPSGLAGYLKYAWTVSGTKFDYWRQTTYATFDKPGNANASSFSDSPALTLSTAQWYWNDLKDKTTETVTGSATLTPPNGQGSVITIASKQSVLIRVPTSSAVGVGGYMQVNRLDTKDTAHYKLWAGPTAYEKGIQNGTVFNSGMTFQAEVTTPSDPAFGLGSLQLVQLVKSNDTLTTIAHPTVVHYDPKTNIICLDKSYPYGRNVVQELPSGSNPPYQDNDSPGLPLDAVPYIYSASVVGSFNDFLMYKAPGDSSWVCYQHLIGL